MSTRSRPSFRRSFQSSFFRSASPEPSAASSTPPSSKPGTPTGKSRQAKRERVKEAIEQFFDKLHHQHHSECSHTSHDARSTDSHSVVRSVSPATSRKSSIDGADAQVKTEVSMLPYDLTEAQAEMPAELSVILDQAIYQDEPVSVSIEPTLAPAAESWVMDGHVRIATETSVDVMIPSDDEEPTKERQRSASVSLPIVICSSESAAMATPSVDSSSVLEPVSPPPPASIARNSSLWHINITAIVPAYPKLRQLMGANRSRSGVAAASGPSEKPPQAGLLRYLFDNFFTRMVAFAFDMWFMVICFFLVKVLRMRPRVLKKVMEWMS